jgi:hypothetical protein
MSDYLFSFCQSSPSITDSDVYLFAKHYSLVLRAAHDIDPSPNMGRFNSKLWLLLGISCVISATRASFRAQVTLMPRYHVNIT